MYTFFRKVLSDTKLCALVLFGSETYSRKYEKLPNTVIHACKNITEKNKFVENVVGKFGFVYLHFDPLRHNS